MAFEWHPDVCTLLTRSFVKFSPVMSFVGLFRVVMKTVVSLGGTLSCLSPFKVKNLTITEKLILRER